MPNKRKKKILKLKKRKVKRLPVVQQIVKVIVNTNSETKKKRKKRGNPPRRYSVRGRVLPDFGYRTLPTRSQRIWKNTPLTRAPIDGKSIEIQKKIDYNEKSEDPDLLSFDRFKSKMENDEKFKRQTYKDLFKVNKTLAQTILMGAPTPKSPKLERKSDEIKIKTPKRFTPNISERTKTQARIRKQTSIFSPDPWK